MSVALELDLPVPDEEALIFLVRESVDWRYTKEAFICETMRNGSYRITKNLADSMEKRLWPALCHYHETGVLRSAETLLQHNLGIWLERKIQVYFNPNIKMWERWTNIVYETNPNTYTIYKNMYNGTVLADGTEVITESFGKMETRMHDFEIERVYPGFGMAYTIAEQLGLDPAGIAKQCHRHVLGIGSTPLPAIPLPAFE